MEVRPAPSSWKWEQGVSGFMIFDGDRQVAWVADKDDAEAVAQLLEQAKEKSL